MSAVTVPDVEYTAAVSACGLLDRSARGKLALTGADAKTFLQGQVSNDVTALTPGHGCYAALLTPKGKMLADLRILDTGDALELDTERVALQELFNVMRRFSLGYDVALHKRTLQRGLLSLIGPGSEAVAGLADGAMLGADEHDHVMTELDGISVRAVRSDVGVDLMCEAESTAALAAALGARGAQPISEATAETIRVERGRPRYGVDLDDSVIPQEADLNPRAVSFTKGCYVGQETVARLYYRGKPNRRLCGLRLAAPDAPVRTGDAIVIGERVVGRLGSVVASPVHGPLALALLRREAELGAEVAVGDGAVVATVVALPFG